MGIIYGCGTTAGMLSICAAICVEVSVSVW